MYKYDSNIFRLGINLKKSNLTNNIINLRIGIFQRKKFLLKKNYAINYPINNLTKNTENCKMKEAL